jgi:hypothetical protein
MYDNEEGWEFYHGGHVWGDPDGKMPGFIEGSAICPRIHHTNMD